MIVDVPVVDDVSGTVVVIVEVSVVVKFQEQLL